MKVVYNACFGGFGLSAAAIEMLGLETYKDMYTIDRHDPKLVEVVEKLGLKANGNYARLEIEDIKGGKYYIDDYCGHETVMTPHDIEWVEVGGYT